jgi:hypothetical protein
MEAPVDGRDCLASPLDALIRLHAEVDRETDRLRSIHAARLQCRDGCCDCCVDGLTVFVIEAERIRRRHAELLSQAAPHPPGACAFLDERGSCRIYADRPYVCRTQGLPLRWIGSGPDGEPAELRDICPLNEPGAPVEALPADLCWEIGPAESRLATLQADLDGGTLHRIPLRSLFHCPAQTAKSYSSRTAQKSPDARRNTDARTRRTGGTPQ